MTTISPTLAADAVTHARAGAGRIRLAAAALLASSATVAVLLVTKPWGDRLDTSSDEFVSYDDLLNVRDAAWSGMLLDGFAFAVIGLTLSLGVLHLARGRGRTAALVGAVLTTAGGILFAMGAATFATFGWFATAGDLPDGAGRSLVDYANDHPGHLVGTDMAGFVVFTLGTLVLSAAVIRAKVVPIYAVVVFLLLTVALFVMPAASLALDVLQIAQMALLIGFAAVVWRRA
jgi:hypothetical protein